MKNKAKGRTVKTSTLNSAALLACFLWTTTIYADTTDDLFNKGISAYQANNYVDTVKFLYAYYASDQQTLTAQSQQELLDAIRYAEEKLWVALATKAELDKYGHVSEVVIEAGGKVDSPTAMKKTQKLQLPADVRGAKPTTPKAEKKLAVPRKMTRPIKPMRAIQSEENQLKDENAALLRERDRLLARCNSKIKAISDQLQERSDLLRSCRDQLKQQAP